MASELQLSVVVVVFGGRESLTKCLDSLTRQEAVEGVEIVVPCDDRVSDVGSLRGKYPGARFEVVEGRRSFAELRAIGVKISQAPIVAITEAQCVPAGDWCGQVLNDHREPHAAIGGVVDKESGGVVSWAMYLCDYSRYMPPVAEGAVDHLTDCNVTYKRSWLEKITGAWPVEFHEPTVHWALQGKGQSLWLSPRIVVRHGRGWTLGEAIADRFAFGRLFAATRVAAVSPGKRAVYALTAFLVPPLIVWRAGRNVMRKGRHKGRLLAALPAMMLVATVWGLGEWVGYVTGHAGRSAAAGTVSAGGGQQG